MADNVIILGAGFSYNASVPLMDRFVDAMWEFAVRKYSGTTQLSPSDIEVFENAERVRLNLDRYHGRARFDDRNIEDILSILTFESLRDPKAGAANLTAINKAITRTIELKCNLQPTPIGPSGVLQGPANSRDPYRSFWRSLLRWKAQGRSMPTIITFNYDLVLERSLIQFLGGEESQPRALPLPPRIDYKVRYFSSGLNEDLYSLQQAYVGGRPSNHMQLVRQPGGSDVTQEIEILKLHGSLNFPSNPKDFADPAHNITKAVVDPCILPPIFNKTYNTLISESWKVALDRLGEAKNIIFVGYSLPATDIYMQYFLKAAIGPNTNLDKIFVFDPKTYQTPETAEPIIERYRTCLAESLRGRLYFRFSDHNRSDPGSTNHFVHILLNNPETILF